MRRDFNGNKLVPGHNVDALNIDSGMVEAKHIFRDAEDKGNMLMLADYCLSRWAKGEELLADKTAVDMGMDFTVWRRILAAARAGAPT